LSEQFLGIDIREEHVALTLVEKTWGGVDIIRSYWFRLYPNQGHEANESIFAQELDGFLENGKVKPSEVLLSLPRQICTLQSFNVPATNAQAMDSMIQLEMERHFAFPLESMSVSYHVGSISPNENHVIAVAAKREKVASYFTLFAQADLKPDEVDLPLSSQMNLLDQNKALGPSLQAIVDISSTHVEVSLIKNKTLLTNRNVAIPDNNFSKAFFHQDVSETSMDQAKESFSDFLTEILESTLYGCKALENDESITQIHLFGGGYFAETLASAIQIKTDVKTVAVLPGFLKKDAPVNFLPALHMTSLGLALKPLLKDPISFNLDPQSGHKAKRKSTWKSTYVLSAIICAVLVVLFLSQTYRNENTLNSLNHQLEEIKPLTAKLQKIDQRYEDLSGYMKAMNAIESKSPLKLPVLQELSQKLPKDTWVTRISIKQNQLEVRGYSASASKLIPLLEESTFFKDTQFKGSVTTRALGKQFTIRSTMEPRG
jgi:Tfp pilus assembly PilM family ATPase